MPCRACLLNVASQVSRACNTSSPPLFPFCCLQGSYCPNGSISPTDCPAVSLLLRPPRHSPIISSILKHAYPNSFVTLQGTWSLGGAGVCSNCPANFYSSVVRATSNVCTACASNKNSSAGAGVCVPLGSWSAQFSTVVNICPAGTASNSPGATSSSSCVICAAAQFSSPGAGTCCVVGRYSAPGTTTCSMCPPGTWSNVQGATSIDNCTKCAAGTYNVDSGKSDLLSCQLCQAGFVSTAIGASTASTCKPCASGYFSNTTGSVACFKCESSTYSLSGATSCQPCPVGSVCIDGVLAQCPPGSYGTATSIYSATGCSNCTAGSYNPNYGAASSASCLSCAAGTFSSYGASSCEQCPSGTSNPSTGASSPTLCALCAKGKYSTFPAQSSCSLLCPAGYFGAKLGGMSFDDACAPCPPGYYSANEGSAQCLPCPAGYYAPGNTSVACTACDFDTFLSSTGGTSRENCTLCPNKQKTTQQGSVSVASCVTFAFSCKPFTQPRISPPKSEADCEPLVCPAWLALDAGGFGCRGCQNGTRGSFGDCQPCEPGRACPGYLLQPLINDASLLAYPLSRGMGATLCSSASLLPPVAVQLTAGPFSFISIPPLSAMVVGGGIILLLLCLPALLPRCPCRHAAAQCIRFLKNSDSFALNRALRDGEPSIYRSSALGGACNIASVVAFLTLATILALRWASDNSIVISTLDTASRANNPFSKNPPWATLAGQSLAPTLGSSMSIQVRVFAESGLGCDAPTQVANLGSGGEWTTTSIGNCGDGRSLAVFTCSGCSLSAAATLSFKLPFTCQALFIEAISIDATGALNVEQVSPRDSSALDNALLTSLTWTLNPMAAIFTDTILGRTSRGLRLLEGSVSPVRSVPMNDLLTPNTAAVDVVINFVLQSTYSTTTLSQKVSLAELLSSIVGLAGVMGAFRFLFQFADGSKRTAREYAGSGKRGCCSRTHVEGLTAGPVVNGADDGDAIISELNPLRRNNINASVATVANAGYQRKANTVVVEEFDVSRTIDNPVTSIVWFTKQEDNDIWFESSAGELAWELPVGAILADSDDYAKTQ